MMLVWPYPYVASAVFASCMVMTLLAVLFYFQRKRKFRFFKDQNIPGPVPQSLLFGNVPATLAKGPTVTVYEWAKEYGPTYGYFEGPLPVLVTSDLDLLQQVLVKQFQYFHGRKLYPVQPTDQGGDNSILVLSDGANWKRVRNIVNPTFTTKKLRQITPLMNKCTDVLMEILSDCARSGDVINVYSYLSSFTLDVIASTAFGLDIDCQRRDSTFKTKCKKVMERFGAFDLLDVLCVAFSEWRPFWTWWSFCRNIRPHPFEWVKKQAGEMIQLRTRDQSARRMDLMQIMLNMSVMGDRDRKSSENEKSGSDRSRKSSEEERRESVSNMEAVKNALNGLRRRSTMDGGSGEKEEGEKSERRTSFSVSSDPLTFKELRCNIALFLVAGFDTTSALLGYLMYELALNPAVQERLYNEFMAELDDDAELTYEDVHKLQYLDCVIKETLRMHPVVSNEIFSRRCCVPEIEVNGVKFIQDMVIKPDVISVHFNQEQWGPQDVNTFCPDRHLPEYSEKRHPLAYLPFGYGPRICVGMRYALLMAKLVAVRILRDNHVTKTDETADLVTKEDVTIIPKSINVLIEKRRR